MFTENLHMRVDYDRTYEYEWDKELLLLQWNFITIKGSVHV